MAEIITIAESGFDDGEQRLERAVAAVIEAGRKAALAPLGAGDVRQFLGPHR